MPVKTKFPFGPVCLPDVARDTTDRNRTAPFAYTGAKFEFRAVGASQPPHRSSTVLNTAMADAARQMAAEITKQRASGLAPAAAVQAVVRATVAQHGRVVFQGNGYSAEWRAVRAIEGRAYELGAASLLLEPFLIVCSFLFLTFTPLSPPTPSPRTLWGSRRSGVKGVSWSRNVDSSSWGIKRGEQIEGV